MSALYTGSLVPFGVLLWPLLIGLVPVVPRWRSQGLRVLPLAPLPALIFALAGAPGSVVLPDLMLGVELAAVPDGALFIGMTALVWMVAGWHAALTMDRSGPAGIFTSFWCLTLAGNLGVFLAADIVTFYLAFAAVSLAAWFLVVHDRTSAALEAGRLYITLAVVGEAALLIGLMIGAAAAADLQISTVRAAYADAPLGQLGLALLIVAFGIKAGMVPLHVWLPVAHPAAPVPGSAVLSGAIVKAGLIGMILFLPDGAGWNTVLIVLGLAGAFGAALWGLTQRNPKAVLAYSTVSQMGLLLVLVGAGSGGVAYYALHHGLAKAALFLCVGLMALANTPRHRRIVLVAAGLLALSVAGLPLTGGALAKLAGKAGLSESIALAVTFSSVTTTLLLGWFLMRLPDIGPKTDGAARWHHLFAGIILLGGVAIVLPWALWSREVPLPRDYPIWPGNLLEGLWPVLAGLALVFLARHLTLPTVPSGDALYRVTARMLRSLLWQPSLRDPGGHKFKRPVLRRLLLVKGGEKYLLRWSRTGSVLMGVALALACLIWFAS